MGQTETSLLSRSDICEKFAVMNVAVFECLTKVVKVVDQCEMLKLNKRKREFLQKLNEEVVQFVEASPTHPSWQDIMKLPLEIEQDPGEEC